MIFLAIFIYILALMIPLWIRGKKISDVRSEGGFKQIFHELRGLVFVYLSAFLILIGIGLITPNLKSGFNLFYLANLQVLQLFFGDLGMSYIVIKITNLNSFALVLSMNLIIIAFINLLPIPGLAMGNVSIALIESIRKKKFNPKRMRIIRFVCIGIFSITVLLIYDGRY